MPPPLRPALPTTSHLHSAMKARARDHSMWAGIRDRVSAVFSTPAKGPRHYRGPTVQQLNWPASRVHLRVPGRPDCRGRPDALLSKRCDQAAPPKESDQRGRQAKQSAWKGRGTGEEMPQQCRRPSQPLKESIQMRGMGNGKGQKKERDWEMTGWERSGGGGETGGGWTSRPLDLETSTTKGL